MTRIGEGANEDTEDDVLDLISHVHLKPTTPLESRLRDVQAATYFLSVLTEMQRNRDRKGQAQTVLTTSW